MDETIKKNIDQIIVGGLQLSEDLYDAWIFDVVRVVNPGETFGEVVLLQPKPRSVTAISLTDGTEILGLSSDNYNRMIEKAVKKDIK